jgi:hypothetical protein
MELVNIPIIEASYVKFQEILLKDSQCICIVVRLNPQVRNYPFYEPGYKKSKWFHKI